MLIKSFEKYKSHPDCNYPFDPFLPKYCFFWASAIDEGYLAVKDIQLDHCPECGYFNQKKEEYS